ncbi:tetratricopeptide repeat protein [Pseudobdellovibrio exovorus]|uniref:Uncharacterized protein n=1 Tax=Pseudobdellovibrio exovorus JSS TaxID=1184267 RepID=M4VAM7_9BACT|nr:tetratricopeptide repeat protein [Pseudobdellovibrio exovorus]AGH96283.1 hypothetical protein A11Q_2067 [Pseudobdellovibrio exovorus JSS]
MIRKILVLVSLIALSSCLKTRSELSGQDQEYLYGQKHADNQLAQIQSTNIQREQAVQTTAVLDDKDELIRTLNGRVEVLENQLSTLIQEKENAAPSEDAQKVTLLQEAVAKMELQIQKLEHELSSTTVIAKPEDKALDDITKPKADESAETVVEPKKKDSYEVAKDHFARKEWKKAILNFQKYTDESPKGKNIADAKYRIGVSFQELGMKEEAMAFYEEVVANYSKTEAGKSARSRLSKLKK